MKIKTGVSNRHVHLTRNDLDILFGNNYELTKRNYLVQPGEYACEETVTLKNNDKILEHVRVIGPLRKYTQVEILEKDAIFLNMNPPVRDSGDLEDALNIEIIGKNGSIVRKSCIIPNRHIHINSKNTNGFTNGEIVKVKYNSQIIDNVHIKIRDDFSLEFQINKDDAQNYNINTGDYVEVER